MTGQPATGGDTETGRDAILRAARRAFTLRPYAEVTMRSIAADAGVSASLIVKRFGSKERLFHTVADFEPAADALFAAPLEGSGGTWSSRWCGCGARIRGIRFCGQCSRWGTWMNGHCCGSGSASRSRPGWPVNCAAGTAS